MLLGNTTPGLDVAPKLLYPALTASLATPIISSCAPLVALPDLIFSYVVAAVSAAPSMLPPFSKLTVCVAPVNAPNIESPPLLLGDGDRS